MPSERNLILSWEELIMKKTFAMIYAICSLAVSSEKIQAAPVYIGYHTISHSTYLSMGNNFNFIYFQPFYSLHSVPDAPDPTAVTPFGTIALTTDSPGKTYLAESNEPGFNEAVSYLTNGTDNLLGETIITDISCFSSGQLESDTLAGPGFAGPDFFNANITSMVLQIDDYRLDQDNDVYLSYHIDYFEDEHTNGSGAATPEPASMLLFGTGLAGLAGLRSRKKR